MNTNHVAQAAAEHDQRPRMAAHAGGVASTPKKILTIALLIFVAAAVVAIVRPQVHEKAAVDLADAATADDHVPAEGLVAYYFHGNTRCPTCRKIERYAQDAIQTGFADKLASGEILWRVVNYEAAANAHFATDYEVVASTLVLVRTSHGHPTEWRNLSRVWGLVGDKEAFAGFVQDQIRELLAKTGS